MHHPKGSMWRKWDLHFHTPSSYDYEDKSISNEEIIENLIHAGVRVVAITDHHIIDVDRIRTLQKLGEGRITVLPGIEFCSDLGGHNSVHFIGLFHEFSDIEYIWHDLSAQLKLTPKDIRERGGPQRVYEDIRKTADLIHTHNGLVSIHAGTKSNSLEAISSKHVFKQAVKTDLLKNHVDILEIGHLDDIQTYEEIIFPSIRENLPLFICSDNHRATEYTGKANCWVKADPSFYGLLQTLVEPEDRIFIGETPTKRRRVATNKTKYIQSITISKKDGSELDEVWFDNISLDLNHDLVAIIGNKGTGKSALAEVLGLVGNSHNEPSFDFLSRQRFRTPKNNRSQHFEAVLDWANNASDPKSLDQSVNLHQREKVKFIPQGLFEEICNDIAAGNENKFNEELEKVIFSHVNEADRLGKSSLQELLAYLTDETFDTITILKAQLHGVNGSIVDIESKLTSEYKQNIENLLDGKRRELEAHTVAKPKEIPKPEETIEATLNAAETTLSQKKLKQEQLETKLKETQNLENTNALLVSAADKAIEQIQNFQEQYRLFKEDISDDLEKIGISFESVAALTIDTKEIQEKRKIYEAARLAAKEMRDVDNPHSLPKEIENITSEIKTLQSKLDEPARLYEAYQSQLTEWEKDKLEIIGTPDKPGTLTYYEARLKEVETYPTQLEALENQRLKLVRDIYAKIKALVNTYQELYEPVQKFSDAYGLSDEGFELRFDVSIVDTELQDKFFNWVAKNRAGSFYADGEEVLKKLVEKFDFNNWENTESFLNEVIGHLKHDQRQSDKPAMQIAEQLRKGQDVTSLYDYIFSLDYLRPRYVLKLDEKELGQLSPGERGALLLIFYLLVDHDDIPLIIDQPEENLDNQTVYRQLVSAIKKAKERRQILVVTHSPNLAVVCDAEQVVCCSIDKKNGNKIEYISGAIENPEINAKIVDILEGTKPAFNNRRAKYAPFENLRLA